MNTKSKYVITINREFGSAGHEIGERLSKALGVKMIDKEVLKAMADRFQVDEKEIGKAESRKPSWWDDFAQFYKSSMDMREHTVSETGITSRQLFVAESQLMKQIAAQESCIIIGRSAFDIFKDADNKFSVFLHADMDRRVRRIMDKYHLNKEDAQKMIEDNDRQREAFTKAFTGRSRYDSRNYDLCLDSGKLGVDETVKTILDLINL